MLIDKLKNCATVDVGKKTGIAIWNGTAFPETAELAYRGKVKIDIPKYLYEMHNAFSDYINNDLSVSSLYDFIQIEGVGYWDGSEKSRMSASRGDLFTVAYLVGVYASTALHYTRNVRIVTAPQWKSQLSKAGTAARVKRINGLTYDSEHITDAVAMGFANEEDIWLLKKKVL